MERSERNGSIVELWASGMSPETTSDLNQSVLWMDPQVHCKAAIEPRSIVELWASGMSPETSFTLYRVEIFTKSAN